METRISRVPKVIGAERYSFDPKLGRVRVLQGSGFDPDNPQHVEGTVAVLEAIAIQQFRDQGDYESADAIAAQLRRLGYLVGTGRGFTELGPLVEARGFIFDP